MKAKFKSIKSGIYLVIDPSMDEQVLLNKLQIILTKEIAAVQIWDNFKDVQNIVELIEKIQILCNDYQTPVLINNQWKYLEAIKLDGVHFDAIPTNIDTIRKLTNRPLIIGLTCGNNLEDVRWAANHHLDYISFCSMFPSSSVSNCEIVDHETVKKASLIFDKPLFLAGGIYPQNLKQLDALNYNGIAVISGVMNSEKPGLALDDYYKNLKSTK